MMQLDLTFSSAGEIRPRPYVPVWLACPKCDHVFLGGIHQPEKPWLKESAGQTAKQVYCVKCDQKPPMNIAETPMEIDRISGTHEALEASREPLTTRPIEAA